MCEIKENLLSHIIVEFFIEICQPCAENVLHIRLKSVRER